MLSGLIVFIHVIVCVLLIVVVLLQSSKGGGLSGFLSGAAESTLGVRGTTTFLHKLTVGLAVTFMLSSLSLAYISARATAMVDEDTVIEDMALPQPTADDEFDLLDPDIPDFSVTEEDEAAIDIETMTEELDRMLTGEDDTDLQTEPLIELETNNYEMEQVN